MELFKGMFQKSCLSFLNLRKINLGNMQLGIAIGIAFGGFGALIQMRLAQSILEDQDFARFLNWNAVFVVFASIFSAPMMMLGLSNWKKSSIQKDLSQSKFEGLQIIFLTMLVMSVIVFVLIGPLIFSNSIIWYVELTMLGSGIQMVYAIQRSLFGVTENWGSVGFQLSIEGLFRIGFFGVLLICNVQNLWVLICSAVLVPLLPMAIYWRKSLRIFRAKRVGPTFNASIRMAYPVWANSLGVLLAFSAPSVVYFVRDASDPEHVVLLGLIFALMRIPVSFAPAFNAPKLVTISNSSEFITSENSREIWHRGFLIQIKYSIRVSILLSIVVPIVLRFLFTISISESLVPVLVSALSTGFYLISENQTTLLFAINRRLNVLTIWLLSIILLLVGLCLVPLNPVGTVIAVAISGAFCVMSHFVFIRRVFVEKKTQTI